MYKLTAALTCDEKTIQLKSTVYAFISLVAPPTVAKFRFVKRRDVATYFITVTDKQEHFDRLTTTRGIDVSRYSSCQRRSVACDVVRVKADSESVSGQFY